MNAYKKGDIVYFEHTMCSGIVKAKIKDIADGGYECNCISIVYEDQTEMRFPGTCGVLNHDTFPTFKEALEHSRNKYQKRVADYCTEITDLISLTEFPLNHCVSHAEEYADQAAIEAYKIRRKNLIGL